MAIKDKLQEYALIAEIISAVAIVLSLIFVGLELRSNTDATFSTNRQSLSSRFESMALTQASSPQLAEVMYKVRNEIELINEEDIVYAGYITANLRLTEEAFLQYRDGQLDEEYWQVRANSLLQRLGDPRSRQLSSTAIRNNLLVKDFSDWLQQALDEMYGV
jgi:hypothetical protein